VKGNKTIEPTTLDKITSPNAHACCSDLICGGRPLRSWSEKKFLNFPFEYTAFFRTLDFD
jgi:hypothetical protein